MKSFMPTRAHKVAAAIDNHVHLQLFNLRSLLTIFTACAADARPRTANQNGDKLKYGLACFTVSRKTARATPQGPPHTHIIAPIICPIAMRSDTKSAHAFDRGRMLGGSNSAEQYGQPLCRPTGVTPIAQVIIHFSPKTCPQGSTTA